MNLAETMTASSAVLHLSLVTDFKEIAKVKQKNWQLKKTIQVTQPKPAVPINNYVS